MLRSLYIKKIIIIRYSGFNVSIDLNKPPHHLKVKVCEFLQVLLKQLHVSWGRPRKHLLFLDGTEL